MFKKITLSLAISLIAAAPIQAATLDSGFDGVLANFSGIDWEANGASKISGYDLGVTSALGATDAFTITYQAFAASIGTTSPTPGLFVAPPGPASGQYELTTFATINAIGTCNNNPCTSTSFTFTGGAWDIFYDNSPDANQAFGTGFRDGDTILSGSWDAGSGGVFGTLASGIVGTAFLNGSVNFTNPLFVLPELLLTTFQASLQFPGQSSPTYTRPAAFDGVATGPECADSSCTEFVVQTDGSQNFTTALVSEPVPLLLLGLGLLAIGFSARRQNGVFSYGV